MLSWVLDHWNDILTITAVLLSAVVGYYQVRHYRAQPANMSIIEAFKADYRRSANPTDYVARSGTEYLVTVSIANDGREATTIAGGSLTLSDTGEELDLKRCDSMRWTEIADKKRRQRPDLLDEKLRVAGNGVQQTDYKATGDRREDRSEPVEGTISLHTVDGSTSTYPVTFTPWEPPVANPPS